MRLVLVICAACLLAGCGTPQELSKQADEVHSVAAEGSLLAHGAAAGDTTEPFTSEHAKALRKLLRPVRGAIEDERLTGIADDVDRTLGELEASPGDEALAAPPGALLLPLGIDAQLLGTVALVAQSALGQIGLILALVGILFAVSGAAIDSGFAGAYSIAQFFGWEWGKYRHNAGAPRFTLAWIVMLLLGFLIVVTGVDPVFVTEISVIFSVVALPLTYIPILLVANDRAYMRSYANGVVANVFGVFYLVVVLVIALAAIPLLLLSNMGQG